MDLFEMVVDRRLTPDDAAAIMMMEDYLNTPTWLLAARWVVMVLFHV